MVPGIEDLLPPPPKKGTKQVEGELLPPPPKKKMEDGTGTSGEIGGTVGASKAQSELPVSKKPVDETINTEAALTIGTFKRRGQVPDKVVESGGNAIVTTAEELFSISDKEELKSLSKKHNVTPFDFNPINEIRKSAGVPDELLIKETTSYRPFVPEMENVTELEKSLQKQIAEKRDQLSADYFKADAKTITKTKDELSLIEADLRKAQTLKKKVSGELAIEGEDLIEATIRTDQSGNDLNKTTNRLMAISQNPAVVAQGLLGLSQETQDKIDKLPSQFITGLNYIKNVEPVVFERITDALNNGLPISESQVAIITQQGLQLEQARLQRKLLKEEITPLEYNEKILQLNTVRKHNVLDNEETLRAFISDGAANILDELGKASQAASEASNSNAPLINYFTGHTWNYDDTEIKYAAEKYAKQNGLDPQDSRVQAAIKYLQDNEGAMLMENSIAKAGGVRELFKGIAEPIKGISNSIEDLSKSSNDVYVEGQSQGNVNVASKRLKLEDTGVRGVVNDVVKGTGQFITQAGLAYLTSGAVGIAGRALVAGETATGANIGNALLNTKDGIATFITAYGQSYDSNLKNALNYTSDNALAKRAASINSAMEGATELFLSPLDIAKGIASKFRSKGTTEELLKLLSDKNLTQNPDKLRDFLTKTLNAVGATTKVAGAEIGEEYVTQISDYVTNAYLNPQSASFQNRDLQSELATTAYETGLSMAIPALLNGIGAANANTFSKGSLLVAAQNRQKLIESLDEDLALNNIDQNQYNEKVSIVNTAAVANAELPLKADGNKLNTDEKADYIFSRTSEAVMKDKIDKSKDEAEKRILEVKIKEQQDFRTELLAVTTPVIEADVIAETTTKETKPEVSEAVTIVNSLEGNNQIPAFELQAMKANPETALQTIADQALGFGRDKQGNRQPLSETANEPQLEAVTRKYGQEVVDKAIAMFPAEKIAPEGVTIKNREEGESTQAVEPAIPTNKKEKLAAFKKNYVEQAQPTATEQKQWNELSMAEKLALAKNNLPEVDNLTNTEAVKVADQNAKMLLAKLNQQPEVATTEDVPPPTEQSGKDVVETGVGKPVTGVAYHGISSKEGKSKGIYLADETSAQNFGDGEVQQYNYTLNKPLVVEKDSDFDVVNKIISDYTKQNPGAKFHPNITDHVNKELEKLGYDGLIIKEQALETEKGYNEIGGTYGEPQIVVFDRKNVSKVEKLKPEIKNEEANNIGNENINKNEPIIADDPAENKIAVAKLTEEDNIEQEPNVKAIGQQAEVAAGIGSKEIEVARDQANELINAAIEVVNVPISEIKTNEQEYQGRKNKFSERSANNVAENFDKNKLQPIVVYKHPDGNTYVLSGHSRLEGMKRRKATTIPATYFEGTPQEAIDFSLKSNKLGTLQTDIENAAYYRKKLLAGESYNAVLKEAKENEQEGSAKRIVSIAHLNPNGKAMQALEALDKGEGDTKNNILNIATKIGDIRAKNDHLTNAHENELFEFMAADKKNIPTDKDLANSNNVLNRSLNQAKFTPEEPLNLDRAVNKSANRIEWERELKELEAQQTELKLAVNPSKKTGWTGLKEKAIATLAKGDNSKEGIEKASLAFENNENGIKDAYQKQLETKRAELASVNDKLAKHLLREKDLIQGDKAQQSLFSIQSPTTQEISDMKDIVKDYVDEGTVSLQDIQNDVAKELGDNSEEMRDLVEKAYNEFTKTTDFAPKEITGDVIGKVGKFLSRLFGGTAASKVFIFKDEKSLLAKASELHGYKIMSSPSGVVLGFAHQGKIYLNAEHINTNSIIHESGHIWTEWVKQNHPEVYTRGMQLVENSQYLKQVRSDEHYKTIASTLGSEGSKEYSDYMKHEALAMAIGDKGAQFVGETRKKDFKEWLNNLWNIIKAAAGFKDITASELQNLTFDEFTKRAAADILRDEEVTQPQGQQQKGTGTAPAAAQPKAKTKLTDVEVGVIREVLDKPIDAKEFPTFFDMNAQGKQQTAVTQEAGQDRMALDGTYVKAHLEDLRSISLNNARVLQDALGKDWKEKLIGFLEDNPTAGNIAQVSGLLNVINTDIYNEIAKSKSGTEISKLKDLQARADRITYDTARSASLALNQRRMYQDFGQGKDVADILSAVILTPEQQAMKSKVEEALKQKFTDEELNKPKPVKPKKAAQPKTTKTAKPKTDDSVKKDLISKGKKAAQQTDADGNVTIVSLKDKIQQANDALNGFKC